jgi:hypothetical protein
VTRIDLFRALDRHTLLSRVKSVVIGDELGIDPDYGGGAGIGKAPRKEGQTIELRLASGTMSRVGDGPIIGAAGTQMQGNLWILAGSPAGHWRRQRHAASAHGATTARKHGNDLAVLRGAQRTSNGRDAVGSPSAIG